jgi:hypothetical protein
MSHKCLFNTDLKQNDSSDIHIGVWGKTICLNDDSRDEINIDTENIDEFIKILQGIKKEIPTNG